MTERGAEVELAAGIPPLRIGASEGAVFTFGRPSQHRVEYVEEHARGYADAGELWSPGVISAELDANDSIVLACSTEPWAFGHS